MDIIKNSKTLKVIILVILSVIAVAILVWSARSKNVTTPSNYNKSIETLETKPEAVTIEESSAPGEGDVRFSQALEAINNKYPWYKYMPINTNEYLIVWELDKEQFRIRLKISSKSPQNTKDMLISKALSNLKEVLNDDLNKYKYYILYND